ncbi:MAG: aldo/keto reductase [Chloroflexota bacterium]
MEWRSLGASGIRIPAVGLSTSGTFDVTGKEAQVARSSLVKTALSRATPLFHVSGDAGEGQRILGAATIGDRSRCIIATSVGDPDWRAGQRQIDRALHYFDGRIDLVAIRGSAHRSRYLSTLERLRRAGAVRAIGLAIYSDEDMNAIASSLPVLDIDYLEIPYNPLCRSVGERLLPAARELGLGVLATHPFAGGRLARVHPPSRSLAQFSAFDSGNWPDILLKWALSEPAVTGVVAGSRKPAHIARNASAGEPWFTPAVRDEVTAIVRRMIRRSR